MRSRDSPIKYYACESRVERRIILKILVIGDVTSPSGIEHLKRNLWKFREVNKIDFCIVNGENASFVTGISPELAEVLLRSGADCISGGNHTLRNRRAYTYLDDTAEMLRPVNFGEEAPGRGYTILDCNGYRILVINALGRVNMNPTLDSPFTHIDRVLASEEGRYDFAILDIHAEATGEKPILLLDDLFDKLDVGRVAKLLEVVSSDDFGQICITDCNKLRLKELLGRADKEYRLFNVEGGDVQL